MRLRQARKIYEANAAGNGERWTERQRAAALRRVQKTATSKAADNYFDLMMRWLGVAGRAEIVAKHDPAAALKVLMNTPEDQWAGDPKIKLVYTPPEQP